MLPRETIRQSGLTVRERNSGTFRLERLISALSGKPVRKSH